MHCRIHLFAIDRSGCSWRVWSSQALVRFCTCRNLVTFPFFSLF